MFYFAARLDNVPEIKHKGINGTVTKFVRGMTHSPLRDVLKAIECVFGLFNGWTCSLGALWLWPSDGHVAVLCIPESLVSTHRPIK